MKISLMMAMTADGKIAKSAGHFTDWTSKEDKQLFVRLTKEAGALIMGRTTYETIGRPLPGRLIIVLTSTPEKFTELPEQVIFMSTTDGSEIVAKLEELNYSQAIVAGGAVVNELFLKNNLIDEIYLTIEPLMFGSGMCLAEKADLNTRLKLINTDKINPDTVLLHYEVIK